MIAAVVAIAIAAAFGLVIVRAFGAGDSPLDSALGEALLIGVGAVALLMEFLSFAHIAWSRTAVPIAVIAAGAAAWIIGTRRGGIRSMRTPRYEPAALPFDLATILLIAGYAIFATLVRLPEHDFLAIWGLKGRTFWEARGIDWAFLLRPANDFCHPDYPLLLPLTFDFVSSIAGRWDDRWIGLLYPAMGLAALLVAREELRRTSASPILVSIAVFALAGFALTPWIGLADGIVAVYALASLSLLRRSVASLDTATLLRASALLGFAAMTKNEGMVTLVAYAAAAILFARHRGQTALRLWPAIAIPLPWLAARAVLGIDSGIVRQSVGARVGSTEHIVMVIRALAGQHILSIWAVVAVALAVVLAIRQRTIRSDTFAIAAVAAQVTLYVAAYVAASYETQWLVRWSWERVASQFILPLAFVAAAMITTAAAAQRTRGGPPATDASPEHTPSAYTPAAAPDGSSPPPSPLR